MIKENYITENRFDDETDDINQK